jgi:uncharacterized protein YigA (DUF484 family)
MKKLQRITYTKKLGITEVDWPAVKKEMDEKIAAFEKDGYRNPQLFADEYQNWIEMTYTESDEDYAKRIEEQKKKSESDRARRIEKLKKEAKELGLKVEE